MSKVRCAGLCVPAQERGNKSIKEVQPNLKKTATTKTAASIFKAKFVLCTFQLHAFFSHSPPRSLSFLLFSVRSADSVRDLMTEAKLWPVRGTGPTKICTMAIYRAVLLFIENAGIGKFNKCRPIQRHHGLFGEQTLQFAPWPFVRPFGASAPTIRMRLIRVKACLVSV